MLKRSGSVSNDRHLTPTNRFNRPCAHEELFRRVVACGGFKMAGHVTGMPDDGCEFLRVCGTAGTEVGLPGLATTEEFRLEFADEVMDGGVSHVAGYGLSGVNVAEEVVVEFGDVGQTGVEARKRRHVQQTGDESVTDGLV